MNSISSVGGAELAEGFSSMHQLGDSFLDSLPKHIAILKIPGRWITGDFRTASVPAHVEDIPEIQQAMREALYHEVTENAQAYAEAAFSEFLKKTVVDRGVLSFSMAGMRPIKQQAWCRVRSSCVLPQTP